MSETDLWTPAEPPPAKPARRWWLFCGIGCGALALLGFGLAVLFAAAGFEGLFDDPQNLRVEVEVPERVRLGEQVRVTARLTNSDELRTLSIGDIDLSEDYLAGFRELAITPKPLARESDGLGTTTFQFGLEIPPRETREVVFELQGVRSGAWEGDLDVWVKLRFATTTLATTVE